MSEDEALDWLATNFGNRLRLLERFVTLLAAEGRQQSLIARSTFDGIWNRHIVDSAQLVRLAPPTGAWIDVGAGGGLPGLVVSILRDAPIVLAEPRRKRSDFLTHAIVELGLTNATVHAGKAQTISTLASVVTARAVASVEEIFRWTKSFVSRETRYLLQRGRSWPVELEIAKRAWHGAFHVEHSITEPGSGIIVARAVAPR